MELIERETAVKLLLSLGSRDYRRQKGTICEAVKVISNPEYAPTIDPIRAAGGCRCGECKYRNTCDHTVRIVPSGPGKGCLHGNLHGCEYGEVGELREVRDDG